MDPVTAAIAPDLLGSIFSIFGAGKARRQAKEDARNKFSDLRDAAIRGGFNPLTALQATGGAGFGNYGSSAPPLASIELLTGALRNGADEFSGAADQRRAADRLSLDLAQLKLDQARSGVIAVAPAAGAAHSVGRGRSPLGRQGQVVSGPAPDTSGTSVAPGRPVDVMPITSDGGVMLLDNALTPGGPIVIPSFNGEIPGWDEALIIAGAYGVQMAARANDYAGRWMYDTGKAALTGGMGKYKKPVMQAPAEPGWMEKQYGKGIIK